MQHSWKMDWYAHVGWRDNAASNVYWYMAWNTGEAWALVGLVVQSKNAVLCQYIISITLVPIYHYMFLVPFHMQFIVIEKAESTFILFVMINVHLFVPMNCPAGIVFSIELKYYGDLRNRSPQSFSLTQAHDQQIVVLGFQFFTALLVQNSPRGCCGKTRRGPTRCTIVLIVKCIVHECVVSFMCPICASIHFLATFMC